MPIFQYKGKSMQGKPVSGEIEAENEKQAAKDLRKQAVIVTSLQKKGKSASIKLPGVGKKKVSTRDIVILTRQLSTMIDAGLPLVQALEILCAQTENKTLAQAIKEVKQSVEGGTSFGDALRKHPKIFDGLYVNMVDAGELGGILDTILTRLSIYIERAMNLKKKVKSAMVYPTVILVVAVVIVAGLLIFVIPQFAGLFTSFGGTLPAPTRLVIAMSDFMVGWGGGVIFISLVSLAFTLKGAYKTNKGKMAIDRFLLKTPVFGILLRKVAVAKFARTLGTLIGSGVPMLDAMEITAKTSGNKVVESALIDTRASISEGKTMAEPLSQSRVFPPMVVQMITVGETTGAMDGMLNKIADFYDDEVDVAVEALTSMLEPMLMVFLGVVVGFIVVAMYLPVFKLAAAIS
ncbi:MAG: type II secretion system F family protein [bacterium]